MLDSQYYMEVALGVEFSQNEEGHIFHKTNFFLSLIVLIPARAVFIIYIEGGDTSLDKEKRRNKYMLLNVKTENFACVEVVKSLMILYVLLLELHLSFSTGILEWHMMTNF